MPISRAFLPLQDIFLELHHSLLRMPKIIEIGQIISTEKRDSKI